MKISIIINDNPWIQNSAAANRLTSLIEGLVLYDVDVKLVFYGGYTSKQEQIRWHQQGVYNSIQYEYLLPRLTTGYWKVRIKKYIGDLIGNKKLLKQLLFLMKDVKSIIWIDDSAFGFQLAYKLKKINPYVKLFTEMSEYLDIHLYNKGNYLQKLAGNVRLNLFEKKAIYAFDGISLMTKTLKNHYQNLLNSNSKLLHLPMTVDLKRFDNTHECLMEFKQPYIAFVGVMNDAKDGVNILIESFNIIKQKFPKFKMYLVGRWNYDTPKHLELIKKYELEERVFWVNEYPKEKIPNIISNADLLVLPRPDSKQAQGGFPTKLGEYLASGNPVCATKVGEIPDYLTDNESVFFAEPGSVDSFAEAMDRALSNPENAKIVGLNGRKVAEKEFNKDIQALKLYNFLMELENNQAIYDPQ